MGKSKIVITLTLAAVLVLLGVACAGEEPTPTPKPPTPAPTATPIPAPPTPTLPPIPEGELRIAIGEMGTEAMDPALNTNSGKVTYTPFYDFMVGVATDGTLSTKTGVAQSWQVGPDSMSMTMKIRSGIKFHNGDDLTAADVKFSLDDSLSERSVSSHADLMRGIIDTVEAPDATTVAITYKKPNAVLANYISRQLGVEGTLRPKKYFEEKGADYFNTHPVGSGPYKFRSQQVGTDLRYEAMDRHWLVGVPKYKYLTFYRVNEESTRIAMLKTGEADVVQISRDKAKEAPGFAFYEKKGSAVMGLYVNNTWDTTTYLSNEKFREALSISINREEIRDFIFEGRAVIVGTGTIYGSYALDYEPVPLEPYDPDRAKQLVEEAFPGETPKIDAYVFPLIPEMGRVAEALAGYWDRIGVETKILPVEYSTYRKELAKEEPDLRNTVGVMRLGNRLLWDGAANILQHSDGLLAMSHDPGLDALIGALRTEADPNLVGKRQRDMALYMQEHHFQIGIVEVGDLYAADPKVVPAWPTISAPLAYELYLDDLYVR